MALISDTASTEWVTIFITCAFLIILVVPIYRLLFHPLAPLPGPKLAALSSWWQIRKIIAGKPYELALHDRYGPIVRTAPNEVVCNSKEAFEVLYSMNIIFLMKLNLTDFSAESSASQDKGPWYGMWLESL